jgi:hypothetical protein
MIEEAEARSETEPAELGFEAYGVRGSLTVQPPDLLGRARALLPPGWTPCPPASAGSRFAFEQVDRAYAVRVDDVSQTVTADADVALGVLDAQIRAYVALHSPDRIFVHAGVVGHGDGAILIPGPSFSGKTSLVDALIRAGATYYSDEFAVLDERGLVHPYPKPLSIRGEGRVSAEVPAPADSVGREPLPIALVAITNYRPGERWQPQPISQAAGALTLLSHTVPARDRPAQALAAVRHATASAVVLEGDRGDAGETAAALLGALRRNGGA